MRDSRRPRAAAPMPEATIKMSLLNAEFLSEYPGGRFPAGAVLEVDEETAERWNRLHIAIPADEAAKTHREVERENLKRRLAEMEREEALYREQGRFRKSVTRESLVSPASPAPMPSRRRIGRTAEVDDLDVVNAAEGGDEDEG